MKTSNRLLYPGDFRFEAGKIYQRVKNTGSETISKYRAVLWDIYGENGVKFEAVNHSNRLAGLSAEEIPVGEHGWIMVYGEGECFVAGSIAAITAGDALATHAGTGILRKLDTSVAANLIAAGKAFALESTAADTVIRVKVTCL